MRCWTHRRLVNHSCAPNCEAHGIYIGRSEMRLVYIVGGRDIAAGEELSVGECCWSCGVGGVDPG